MTTPGAPVPALTYAPALDGLRAVAILAVMASHSQLDILRSGWIGVDLFFVLSGFLITTLLLQERDRTGRIDLYAFVLRRAYRLLPALSILLAVFSVWALVDRASVPGEESGTVAGIPAAALYVAAWFKAFGWSQLGALEHTWSLSVEEHFYLLWPSFLLVMLRWRNRPVVVIGSAYALAIAYRLSLVDSGASWDRMYAGPDARAEQLLAGCLLAALLHARPQAWTAGRKVHRLGVTAAVTMLVLANFLGGHPHLWVGMTATGVLSAVIIGATQRQPEAPLARLLASKPLVWLGRRSYAMYLWYWPVFWLFRDGRVLWGWRRLALELPFIIGLAAISYVVAEQPMLALGHRRAEARLARRAVTEARTAT